MRLLLLILLTLAIGATDARAKPTLEELLQKYATGSNDCVSADSLRSFLQKDDIVIQRLRSRKWPQERIDRAIEYRQAAVEHLCWDGADDSLHDCKNLNVYSIEKVLNVLNASDELLSGLPVAYSPKKKLGDFPKWPATVAREVNDQYDPRSQAKALFPAVLSYLHNPHNHADPDQLNILGAVTMGPRLWDLGSKKAHGFGTAFGVEADVAGGVPSDKTEVKFQLPLSTQWVWTKSETSLQLGLVPNLSTDRAFRRDVRTVKFGFTPLGQWSWGGTKVKWLWVPTGQVEYGAISNAGGNASLIAIKQGGPYWRAGGVFKAKVTAVCFGRKLGLGLNYQLNHDLDDGWTRHYSEEMLTIDFVPNGKAAFAITQRNGRKAPTFDAIDQTLIGVGVRLGAIE